MHIGASPEENPNYMMAREGHGTSAHTDFMIAKDREYEKMKKHIENEFKVLDKNRDGMITMQELFEFL